MHAGIENYFLKAENKTAFTDIENIDFLYVISLDERPQKYAHVAFHLNLYGITPYRFSAINGWTLSLEALEELGVRYHEGLATGPGSYFTSNGKIFRIDEPLTKTGQTYYCHDMRLGAIGCVLSHLSVLQDAYDAGYETIWVMEDDIEIHKNPHLISEYIEKLDQLVGKKGWDVLFTDPNTKNQMGEYVPCLSHAWRPNYKPPYAKHFQMKKPMGNDFFEIGARYGTYSMVIRRSGMQKLLNFLKEHKLFLPYDMEMTLPPGIKLFVLKEDLVSTQPMAPTDNGFPNYLQQE